MSGATFECAECGAGLGAEVGYVCVSCQFRPRFCGVEHFSRWHTERMRTWQRPRSHSAYEASMYREEIDG